MSWEPVEADEEMAARIRAEYGQIHAHLGGEAPDISTEVEIMRNIHGDIRFLTPTEAFTLAGDVAVRYRPHPDGTEDVSYWKDGSKIKHIVNPPLNESN